MTTIRIERAHNRTSALLWLVCVLGGCAVATGPSSSSSDCNQAGEGANCAQNIDDCAPDPCVNGACVDGDNSYSCTCALGWSGTNCDEPVNGCEANPCVNGSCSDGVDSYTCTCDPGWTGPNCDAVDACPGGDDRDADSDGTPDACDLCPTDATDDPDGDGLCNARGTPTTLHFQPIAGGSFLQGSDIGNTDEQPIHEVTVPSFEILRTEVTVAQFAACVAAGACVAPGEGVGRNWNDPGYENHPINAVDRQQATAYCTWAGGRLPTESEWEYAARSQGADVLYPWGDAVPSCLYASMNETGSDPHCGTGRTSAVCSRPPGNTAQGLCDMAGNVREWVQDAHHFDYVGAPTDGSAWGTEDGGSRGVNRGGSTTGDTLRAARRQRQSSGARDLDVGFRCARDDSR